MSKPAAYILSAYSFIPTLNMEELLDVGYQSKDSDPIPSFDENVLIKLCSDAQKIFEKESNILQLDGDLTIVGDIHGSFHDLLRILKYIQEKDSKVLFLGDYVDRGNFSLECITILFALKVMRPDNFFLLRGNHEFDALCSQYGFKDEIINYHNPKKCKEPTNTQIEDASNSKKLNIAFNPDKTNTSNQSSSNSNEYDEYYTNYIDMNCYKYSEKLYEAFIKAFSYLPIGALINQTNFCIHGGLSPRLESVNQLRYGVFRPINNFEDNRLLSDVLWSDPSSDFSTLFSDNPRGRGFLFSMDATTNFLNTNSLKRIIRGHQCVKHGKYTQFNEKCITVFSASSYDQNLHNSSGILELFQKDDSVHFTSFPPLKRLEKSDASYYKVQAFNDEMEDKSHVCFSFLHPKLTSFQAVRMVTNTPNKKIKNHQSLQFPKPLHRTSSRNTNPLIRKPVILHSVSMNNFNTKDEIDPTVAIGMTRSIFSFNDILNIND